MEMRTHATNETLSLNKKKTMSINRKELLFLEMHPEEALRYNWLWTLNNNYF